MSLHMMSVLCNCSATGVPVTNNVVKYLLNRAITTIFTLAGCYESGRKRDILRKPKHTHAERQTDRQTEAQTNPLQDLKSGLISTTRQNAS